jgi:ankyrin repeat protein
MSEAKVNVSSQGLLVVKRYLSQTEYSQEVLRGMTGLHLTAYFRVTAIVKLLLDIGKVEADSKEENGRTPLF